MATTSVADPPLALSMKGVVKRFGRTLAVDGVSLAVRGGEVVGLVGENGAGKTTLMSIAAGELAPDEGEIHVPSRVGMVHQHFAIAAELSIAENLALLDRAPFRFLSPAKLERDARRAIARSGLRLGDVLRRAGDLSVGEKAKLELIKALSVDPPLLVLDEPTSVLTPPESAELFAVIRRLAREGSAVVFVTHKVAEVLEIAARIVVMREGRIVHDAPAAGSTAQSIAEAMVGSAARAPSNPPVAKPGPMLLALEGVSGQVLRGVDLTVRQNEIVAVVGVAGNGQSELAGVLRGVTPATGGTLDLRTRRVAFIPEDRTRDGIVAEMTVAENLALGRGRWSWREAEDHASALIAAYGIRTTGPRQRAGDLSGGNQQKVVLARVLDRRPELIVAAEPTRGLDIEGTRFVHEQLRTAAGAGAGVLLITSDLDEAFALAGVVHVINGGRVTRPLTPEEAAANIGPLLAGIV